MRKKTIPPLEFFADRSRAGKDFQEGAKPLELARPLDGGPRRRSQTFFGATSRGLFTVSGNSLRYGFTSLPFSTEPFRGTILARFAMS
jgi:hypothetical protein